MAESNQILSVPDVGSKLTKLTPGVLRTLKKRPVRRSLDMVNISSYNSDFLSGLFADVAKANVLSQFEIGDKRGPDHVSSEGAAPSPRKKSRVSLNKCLSRARASQMNLSSLVEGCPSPKGVSEFLSIESSKYSPPDNTLVKSDSLAFQLNCISESSTSVCNAARFAFPNLPATISDSSCATGLTRASLVRQASTPEAEMKESFGWFVDLDENGCALTGKQLAAAVSSDDLAFQAQVAPNGSQDEAELEWAQAADTVDDVLGDFF